MSCDIIAPGSAGFFLRDAARRGMSARAAARN